jgi:HPt (histidine-containing phosphotransfer) domain-containing protein
MQGTREKCLAAGMDDYITKPVRSDDLRALLERWRKRSATPLRIGLTGSQPSVEVAVLDAPTIVELRRMPAEDGVPMLVKVIDMFLDEAPRNIEQIKAAASRPDQLVSAAHRLRGVSLNVGARRIAQICKRLEELAPSGQSGCIDETLTQLETAFDETRAVLAQVLDRGYGPGIRANASPDAN